MDFIYTYDVAAVGGAFDPYASHMCGWFILMGQQMGFDFFLLLLLLCEFSLCVRYLHTKIMSLIFVFKYFFLLLGLGRGEFYSVLCVCAFYLIYYSMCGG